MANALSLWSTRGQSFWRIQSHAFGTISHSAVLIFNLLCKSIRSVNVQAQSNYVRCYFSCEQHIKFWTLSLLQISTMKFSASFQLMMSRHLETMACFFISFWMLNLKLSRHCIFWPQPSLPENLLKDKVNRRAPAMFQMVSEVALNVEKNMELDGPLV